MATCRLCMIATRKQFCGDNLTYISYSQWQGLTPVRSKAHYYYTHLVTFYEDDMFRLPLNPIREIGSVYPTNVYDGNRLSLPIPRQNMAQYGLWCLVTCQMVDVCDFGDQNTWNTIPVSEQKIILNNQVIKHWIVKQKQMEQTEQNCMNKSRIALSYNSR